MLPPEKRISPKREKAVMALLEQPTIAKAAEQAGVHESTLYRWLKEHNFQRHLAYTSWQMKNRSINRMRQTMSEAVNLLEKVVKDEKESTHARLAAARTIIDRVMQ